MPGESLDGLISKGLMNIRILVAIDNFNRSHKCASQQKSLKYTSWVQNKKRKMISVHFPGKPFNIRLIQVCALTTNAEEAEVGWFSEDLQGLLELLPKKMFFSSSVQFSHSIVSNSLRPNGLLHAASLSITNSWSLLKLMSI